MTTPAARRYQTVVAAQAAATSGAGEQVVGSQYELMLAKLYNDKRRLKDIQSIERKIEVKREILPEYATWIGGVLAAGKGGQDEVLTTAMVWHVDAGNYEEALRIGAYVLEHDLTLPDQYERTPATVLVDEISDAALAVQKNEKPFPMQILLELQAITADLDMPDQARAKLHKALGYELHQRGNLQDAEKHYARALELNDRIGVKRDLKEIQSALES